MTYNTMAHIYRSSESWEAARVSPPNEPATVEDEYLDTTGKMKPWATTNRFEHTTYSISHASLMNLLKHQRRLDKNIKILHSMQDKYSEDIFDETV